MIKKGLTLVELALTVALASMIALAVYATLSNGIRIWQEVSTAPAVEDAAIFFQKITEELENGFKYPGIRFEGGPTRIAFATMIHDRLQYAETGQGIGEVFYAFDNSAATLNKGQLTSSDIFQGRQPLFSPVLTKVNNIALSYYFFDKEKKTYLWQPDWPPQEGTPDYLDSPLAVGISISLNDGKKTYAYNETVFLLPSGQ